MVKYRLIDFPFLLSFIYISLWLDWNVIAEIMDAPIKLNIGTAFVLYMVYVFIAPILNREVLSFVPALFIH